MANLVDFKFETVDGPNQALERAKLLRRQYILEAFNAVLVSRPAGAKKLQMQQLVPTMGKSTLDGAFWGKLFGLISSHLSSAWR